MAQRERALLRKWFGKGCYPTAAQFADWLDSFWHKAERIAISSIEGLAERLNEKFEASSGEELERQHEQLKKDFDAHERDAKNDFRQLFDNVNELEDEDERLADVIAAETTRAAEQEAAIRQEFAAADAQEATTREQKDAETLQSAKEYTDVNLAAESANRKAADADVLEHAKQYTETSIATERVIREAAERAIREAVSNYVDQKVAELVNGSPEALDTLLEISEALGNNPNFAADILAQLGGKVDKVAGKQLSTEDFTTDEKSKLAGIADNANNYVHPSNHPASMIAEDATRRFVTDAEKMTWSNKAPNTNATQSAAGLMSPEDKEKLDNLDTSFVTLNTEQPVAAKKDFRKGIRARSQATQDDPGVLVEIGDGGYAVMTLGDASDTEYAGFYKSHTTPSFWRDSIGGADEAGRYWDIRHPRKAGTIALTSDLASKVSSSQVKNIAGPMTQAEYAALTPDANTLYIITD
ncbi:MAG: hypothetical protein NC250_01190 [Alistipes senegalensis]|nr:hypothetical protein [Bacteroides cellulosilyticus]MCM1351333.1 hypothetical protein [Alistipes senegalensis]